MNVKLVFVETKVKPDIRKAIQTILSGGAKQPVQELRKNIAEK